MGGEAAQMGGLAGAAAGIALGLVVVSLLAYVARVALHALNDAVFRNLAQMLDGFAAGTRRVAAGVLAEARETLSRMARQEFANEAFSRTRELMDVLERFEGLRGRHDAVIAAVSARARTGEGGDAAGSDRAVMTLAAELATGHEKFNAHIEFIRKNEDLVRAVHHYDGYGFSPFIRLIFASLFMPLILMGGVLNFFLIKRPLDTLFVDGGYVFAGGVTMAEVCAATVIVIEAVIGFFFLESLRITKVLPNFHALGPRARAVWASIFFLILAMLAAIEASLAIWRENLMALSAAVEAGGAVDLGAAPLVFQILLGVMMPFILALVAIPLETFLKNARVVALFLFSGALQLVALPLGLTAAAARFVAGVAGALIDLAGFLPAAVRRTVAPVKGPVA